MTPFRSNYCRNAIRALCLTLAVSVLIGCTGEPKGLVVSGHVQVHNAPLAKGSIVLSPLAGTKAPKRAARIENGQFEFTPQDLLQQGKYRVEIYADEELPFALDDPQQFAAQKSRVLPKNPIAAEFNSQSKLEAELSGDGPHTLSFSVTRQP